MAVPLHGGDQSMSVNQSRVFLSCLLILFTASAVFVGSTATADESACQFDQDEMLRLDFNAFDQSYDQGWRVVAEQEGCELAAADLIRNYIEHHQTDHVIIVFHEAQLRAKAGQIDRAVELFRQTRIEDGQMTAFGWNEYVDASIAFLERDRQALVDARDRLTSLTRPSNLGARDRHGNPIEIEWPPNIGMVNGFVACFDKSYKQAYDTCSK